MRSIVRLGVASVAAALVWTSAAHAGIVFRTAALSGAQAPGTDAGALFDSFDVPVLDAQGGVAFRANLQTTGGGVTETNDQGVWSEGSGSLALVTREESQAPGAPAGANFNNFSIVPAFNALGRSAFRATLQTTGGGVDATNDTGIWSEGSGSLALIAREGSQAPGTPAGANFNTFETPNLNVAGRTAFRADLKTTGGGVTSTSNSGIWSEGAGALVLVAREGSQAPDTPSGANFNSFIGDPSINASGRVVFAATLQTTGGGVTSDDDTGIWSQGSGALALVAREGSQAPGAPAGANFDSFGVPRINAAGRTTFSATLQTGGGGVTSDDDAGIWSEGPGTLTLVARKGNQAPGTSAGTNFAEFSNPVINAAGRTAFEAGLTGPDVTGANETGIWSEGTGLLALVARQGSQAPGAPTGANFESFSSPAMNEAGSVAFLAILQQSGGGVDSTNDQGIWAEDMLGQLTLIVRTGDQLAVAPGDLRTISSLGFLATSGGEDGRGVTFNDNFTLAFSAQFDDGTSGVFTALIAVVPEAQAWAFGVVASCLAVAAHSWRQRA